MILQRARVFAAIALSFWTANGAHAVDRDWNQATGVQVFNTGTNWTPSGTPAAGDNLAFPLNGDVDVYLGAPSVGNNITFTDGIVEFLDVGGSTLNSGGVMTIDDTFAAGLGDGAQITVNGAAWDNADDAVVGDAGFGLFTLNSSGEFRSEDVIIDNQAGSVGAVNVDGAGATLHTDGPNESDGFVIGKPESSSATSRAVTGESTSVEPIRWSRPARSMSETVIPVPQGRSLFLAGR